MEREQLNYCLIREPIPIFHIQKYVRKVKKAIPEISIGEMSPLLHIKGIFGGNMCQV